MVGQTLVKLGFDGTRRAPLGYEDQDLIVFVVIVLPAASRFCGSIV